MSKNKTTYFMLREELEPAGFSVARKLGPDLFEVWAGLDFVCTLTHSDGLWAASHNTKMDREHAPARAWHNSAAEALNHYRKLLLYAKDVGNA